MEVSLSQLVYISIWAFLCGIDQFCGLFQIHRPLVTGAVIGLILGDLSRGIAAGSILELMFLGITPLSGVKPMNVAVGGILGVAFVILMKVPPETAATIAVPFAIITHGFISFIFILYSILINQADYWADNTNFKSLAKLNYSGMIVYGLSCAFIIFLTIYYGAEEAQLLNEIIPAWVLSGLVSAGGMLPGIGLALLLSNILNKQYIAFLLIGFFLTTTFYMPLTMLFCLGLCFVLYDFYRVESLDKCNEIQDKLTRDYVDPIANRNIIGSDLNFIMLRSLFLQASFNFERMQAGGWLYSLLPALQKIHNNNIDLKNSLKMHLDFFNTSPFFVNFIMGFVIALEEKKQSRRMIKAAKMAMMVPLQTIGDAIYILGILPLTAALGASLTMDDDLNGWGVLTFLLIFNFIHIGLRLLLTHYGYSIGRKCVYINKNNLEKYCNAALMLGIIMIGGLITYLVRINISWVITIGPANIALQAKVLDSILPNMIPLIYTLLMVYLVKKNSKLNHLVIGTIVFALCGTGFGIM